MVNRTQFDRKQYSRAFYDTRIENPLFTITSNASTTSGALLSKILAPVVQFSIIETLIYINVLELKSILFGLKSSYDHICDSYIKTRYDNLTAVHCINNMGS